jgi:hypothetical protein
VLDAITDSVPQWKSEYKLSFDQFVSLVTFLMTGANKHIIRANEEDLIALPLGQW